MFPTVRGSPTMVGWLEWPKALVLKNQRAERLRGFESHPHRQAVPAVLASVSRCMTGIAVRSFHSSVQEEN